jgi:hypothetical protein
LVHRERNGLAVRKNPTTKDKLAIVPQKGPGEEAGAK